MEPLRSPRGCNRWQPVAMFDTAAGFVLGWRPNAPFTGEAVATSLDGAELYLGGEGAFDVFRQ
jgi:hypothetical protein